MSDEAKGDAPEETSPGTSAGKADDVDNEPTVEVPKADAASGGSRHITLSMSPLVAGVLAAVLLLGAGFAIGWVSAPSDDRADVLPRLQQRLENRLPDRPDRPGPPNLPERRGIVPAPDPDDQQDQSFLGVSVADAGDDAGAQVQAVVPDSPADDAGLEPGDVITAVDGDDVSSAEALVRIIRTGDAGDEITLTYRRGGSTHTVDIELGARQTSVNPGN